MHLIIQEKLIIQNIINDLIGFPFKIDTKQKFDHAELRELWKRMDNGQDSGLSKLELKRILDIVEYYLTLENDSDSTVGVTMEEIKHFHNKLLRNLGMDS